ncbi:MAG: hypothetical protein V1866_01910 [archaeon]
MMLLNPTREFYIKAAMHAKQQRMSDLNSLETDLIVLEESVIELRQKGVRSKHMDTIEINIDGLKRIIREKKQKLL